MPLFKMLKGAGAAVANPVAVAKAIIEAIPKNALVGKAEVAGAGFINVHLDNRCVTLLGCVGDDDVLRALLLLLLLLLLMLLLLSCRVVWVCAATRTRA